MLIRPCRKCGGFDRRWLALNRHRLGVSFAWACCCSVCRPADAATLFLFDATGTADDGLYQTDMSLLNSGIKPFGDFDAAGNVYVRSGNFILRYTSPYSPLDPPAGTIPLAGAANSFPSARSDDGFVCGHTAGISRYDSSDNLLWFQSTSAIHLAYNDARNGRIYDIPTNTNTLEARDITDGSLIWSATMSEFSLGGKVGPVCDVNGDIVIFGAAPSPSGVHTVSRYDNSSALVWTWSSAQVGTNGGAINADGETCFVSGNELIGISRDGGTTRVIYTFGINPTDSRVGIDAACRNFVSARQGVGFDNMWIINKAGSLVTSNRLGTADGFYIMPNTCWEHYL